MRSLVVITTDFITSFLVWLLFQLRDLGSSQISDTEKKDEERKIIRGGSWFNEPEALRSANRHRHPVDSKQTNLGFRVVWKPTER